MPLAFKVVLLAICTVMLVFVTIKLIVPLIVLYVPGVGVINPLPRRLAMAYPKLAVHLFVFGGPLLLVGLLGVCIWLLRPRVSP